MVFDFFVEKAFWVLVIVSGVPLVLASISGLIVAVFQAATQIQEQSILYLIKVSTLILSFIIFGGWFWSECLDLFQQVLLGMSKLGGIN